jgi:hypothetical protein
LSIRALESLVVTGGPILPDGVDEHVEAFVGCRRDRVELPAGPVNWLPMPPGVPRFMGKPRARFSPNGDAVYATVKWGLASITLRARIDAGFLAVSTNGFAFGLEGAIQRWVADMNTQLKARGRRLDRIMLVGDDAVIVKRMAD